MYTDELVRKVNVSTLGIVEALRKVYKTPALLNELGVPMQREAPRNSGNSLSGAFMYTDKLARVVNVSTLGIVEALRKVYKTPALLKELGVPEVKKGLTE